MSNPFKSATHCKICGFDVCGESNIRHHVKAVHQLDIAEYRRQYAVKKVTTAKYASTQTEITCRICGTKRLRPSWLVEGYKAKGIVDHTCGAKPCVIALRSIKLKQARNTPESKAATSAASKRMWAGNHAGQAAAILKGMKASAKYNSPGRMARALATTQSAPTKPEQTVIAHIVAAGLPFTYTGNGAFFVEKLNPDFVSTGEIKAVILVQGCYWHGCATCFPKGKNRALPLPLMKAIYERNGYRVVDVWEHELKGEAWKAKLSAALNPGVKL